MSLSGLEPETYGLKVESCIAYTPRKPGIFAFGWPLNVSERL